MKIAIFERPDGDNPFAALFLVLSGVMILGLQDSLVKFMSSDTSLWQFQALRALGNGSLVMLMCALSGNFGLVVPVNWKPVLIRAGVLTLCMFCFFSGAPVLSVAQMAAGLYTYPIFVTLLAAPVLGEQVGRWRLFAVVLGACGALTILRPWTADFSFVQILPVCAGFLYAINVLIVRRFCREESPLALTFAVATVFLATAVIAITTLSAFPPSQQWQADMPFIAIGWPALTKTVLLFAVIASFLNLFGNIFLNRAYQTAESSWLAPLDFSYLFFAALWGKLLFDTWPAQTTLLGMLLIAGAGMLTAWREHKQSRAAKAKQPKTRNI